MKYLLTFYFTEPLFHMFQDSRIELFRQQQVSDI